MLEVPLAIFRVSPNPGPPSLPAPRKKPPQAQASETSAKGPNCLNPVKTIQMSFIGLLGFKAVKAMTSLDISALKGTPATVELNGTVEPLRAAEKLGSSRAAQEPRTRGKPGSSRYDTASRYLFSPPSQQPARLEQPES